MFSIFNTNFVSKTIVNLNFIIRDFFNDYSLSFPTKIAVDSYNFFNIVSWVNWYDLFSEKLIVYCTIWWVVVGSNRTWQFKCLSRINKGVLIFLEFVGSTLTLVSKTVISKLFEPRHTKPKLKSSRHTNQVFFIFFAPN
jgi:hypothetical protein